MGLSTSLYDGNLIWVIGSDSPQLRYMLHLTCFNYRIPREDEFGVSHIRQYIHSFAVTDEGRFIVDRCAAMSIYCYKDHLYNEMVIRCDAWLSEEDHMQVALTWQ